MLKRFAMSSDRFGRYRPALSRIPQRIPPVTRSMPFHRTKSADRAKTPTGRSPHWQIFTQSWANPHATAVGDGHRSSQDNPITAAGERHGNLRQTCPASAIDQQLVRAVDRAAGVWQSRNTRG